jgi:hypothetical protein
MMRLSFGPGSIPASQAPEPGSNRKLARVLFCFIFLLHQQALSVAPGLGKAVRPLFLFLGSTGRLDLAGRPAGRRMQGKLEDSKESGHLAYCRAPFSGG